jgi:serine/threonine-protein kinase
MDFAQLVRDPNWSKQAIPGYRLGARVASGGFATLHAAEPVFGGDRVAVKILHSERAVERFALEAKLLRRLDHPGIVHAIDAGFDRGQYYLVMEYVEGRSLGQALHEGAPSRFVARSSPRGRSRRRFATCTATSSPTTR